MEDHVQLKWLTWAREPCGSADHVTDCIRHQATLQRKDPERWSKIVRPGVRWPGYLGTSYRVGGILSVGIVHTDFSTAGLRGGGEVRRAVEAHLAWHEGRLEDADWLRTLHSMYRAGLCWPGGWSVAKHHSYYWSRLGESVDSVAYVNAMRCQWPGAGPPGRIVDDCVAKCSLFTLVNTIKPRLVISNSRAAFERLRASVPTLYVHQLNGRNLAPVELAAGSDAVTIRSGDRLATARLLEAAGMQRSHWLAAKGKP